MGSEAEKLRNLGRELDSPRQLTPAQVAAIIASEKEVERILVDEPGLAKDIVRDYETGDLQKIIAKRYYGKFYEVTSMRVARNVVSKIIEEGLPEERRRELAHEHNLEHGKKIHKEGKGIHDRTPEEMSGHGRKAGKIGGRKTYEEKKGVHGMSREDRQEAGRKSAIARGVMPYNTHSEVTGMTEGEYVMFLTTMDEFRQGSKMHETSRIAEEVNSVYGNGRNMRSILNYINRSRKIQPE